MENQEKLKIDLDFLDEGNIPHAAKKEDREKNNTEEKLNIGESLSPKPWIRYWARYLDIIMFSFVFGIILNEVNPSILKETDIVLTIMILFVWIFVEAILLSSWGKTPGKWLLKIDIKSDNEENITFSNALNRSFAVWFKGLGFGIPIVAFFTQISAYNSLKNNGITSWDKDNHFTISHGKIGAGRIILSIIIFIIFLFLIAS